MVRGRSSGWIASNQPRPRLSSNSTPVKSIHCGLGHVLSPSGRVRKTSCGMLVARMRKRSSFSCSRSLAACCSLRSRAIFTKPRPFLSGINRPDAQNRSPVRRRCQRSSSARPSVAARDLSISGTPMARSSGVNRMSAHSPTIWASECPNSRSAPIFQLVVSPARSVVKIAKSVELSMIRENTSASSKNLVRSLSDTGCPVVLLRRFVQTGGAV